MVALPEIMARLNNLLKDKILYTSYTLNNELELESLCIS